MIQVKIIKACLNSSQPVNSDRLDKKMFQHWRGHEKNMANCSVSVNFTFFCMEKSYEHLKKSQSLKFKEMTAWTFGFFFSLVNQERVCVVESRFLVKTQFDWCTEFKQYETLKKFGLISINLHSGILPSFQNQ